MIRFRQFLLEDEADDYSARATLIKAVRACKSNLELIAAGKVKPLWRGDEMLDGELVMFPTGPGINFSVREARTKARQSRSGNEAALAYTVANWKEVPSRAHSVFGTFSRRFAVETFDSANWLIPFDSVKRFVYTDQDFNIYDDDQQKASLHNFLADLNYKVLRKFQDYVADNHLSSPAYQYLLQLAKPFSGHFQLFGGQHDEGGPIKAMHDPKHINAVLKFIDTVIKNVHAFSEIVTKQEASVKPAGQVDDNRPIVQAQRRLVDHIIDVADQISEIAPGGVVKYLEDNFTPKAFKLQVVSDLGQLKPSPGNTEVWFEGPYLLIDGEYPQTLLAEGVKRQAKQLLSLLEESDEA